MAGSAMAELGRLLIYEATRDWLVIFIILVAKLFDGCAAFGSVFDVKMNCLVNVEIVISAM